MNNLKSIFLATLSFCIVLSVAALSESLIVNYDNNPDLQKAMEYDLSMNKKRFIKPDGTVDQRLYDSYVENADQKLAEKYYLKYLKDINEPFQRARVYAK